jgi:cell division protein ZapD
MRLEDLFARARFFAAADDARAHHAALTSMFEITEVAGRADLKTELLQELERQKQILSPLRDNPEIETHTLDELLAEMESVSSRLYAQTGKVGQHLRDNEWLTAIRQRSALPGGVCEFDLPAYHFWLHRSPETRRADLADWLAPFEPLDASIRIVLRLLRDHGRVSRHVAHHGVFQLMLTTQKVAQLLRLTVSRDFSCIPEISANKYALNVRFLVIDGTARGAVIDRDIEFDMMFCNL